MVTLLHSERPKLSDLQHRRNHSGILCKNSTLLHSGRPKLHTILAFLSAVGLNSYIISQNGFFCAANLTNLFTIQWVLYAETVYNASSVDSDVKTRNKQFLLMNNVPKHRPLQSVFAKVCVLGHYSSTGTVYSLTGFITVEIQAVLGCFLARLDEVQEELLFYPRRWQNVKVFHVMGKALSGELSCPGDRSCFYQL